MKKRKRATCLVLTFALCILSVFPAAAQQHWPEGPAVEGANICVMEMNTGTILYEKNMDEVHYPASITKVMTALLALENCTLNETVIFSPDAVFKNEGNTSNICRDVNEEMTMEECLYGMMLESANECAYAIGEHIGGTMDAFVKMMNDKAKELGCTNTHFNNPNGLPDESHVTTAHDMALIGQAAYKNETFRVIVGSKSYTIPPTNKHDEETPLHNHHKMVYPYRGDYQYLYEYCTGGKTGYTDAAGSTLITFAEKDGLSLVCVVMNENSPAHWTDTLAAFEYTFENFKLCQVSEMEKEDKQESGFAKIDEDACVVLPATAEFSDLDRKVIDSEDNNVLGILQYSYADHVVGQAKVFMNEFEEQPFQFTSTEVSSGDESEKSDDGKHMIDIEISKKTVFIVIGTILALLLLFVLLRWINENAYLIRQKMAAMKSRHAQKNRYLTIRDTRKYKKRQRKKRKKDLHF